MPEKCVCCGAAIPEGRQICPCCEKTAIPKRRVYAAEPVINPSGMTHQRESLGEDALQLSNETNRTYTHILANPSPQAAGNHNSEFKGGIYDK